MTLSGGLKEFNEKGIQKLVDAAAGMTIAPTSIKAASKKLMILFFMGKTS